MRSLASRYARASAVIVLCCSASAVAWFAFEPGAADPPADAPSKSSSDRNPAASPGAPTQAPTATLNDVVAAETRRDVEALVQLAEGRGGFLPTDDQERTRLRVTAIHALAKVGGSKAVAYLRALVQEPRADLVVRLAATAGLARNGSDAEVRFLRDHLEREASSALRAKIQTSLAMRTETKTTPTK